MGKQPAVWEKWMTGKTDSSKAWYNGCCYINEIMVIETQEKHGALAAANN